jgi:uronate dehydrogenase
VKRIIFASSNHTVGFYRNTDYIDATAPTRPDSFYGVSKCFGEQLASYYWDRTGLETCACASALRSRAGGPPHDGDVAELRRPGRSAAPFAVRNARRLHHPVRHVEQRRGVVGQQQGSHLGYKPKDSSSQFDAKFPDSGDYPDKNASVTYHGGAFALAEVRYKD